MNPVPREITRAGEHDIKIIWHDGHESVFLARQLRLACPCAACVEEMTGRALLHPQMVPQDVRPSGIVLVGRYGMQVRWSDGHDTGIYTFEQLRQICPCPQCKRSG